MISKGEIMNTQEYKTMFDAEESHWWYKGLQDLVFSTVVREFGSDKKIRILDAGCGTGRILEGLIRYGNAYGIDTSEVALFYCRQRRLRRITRASVMALPFRDESFDLVISTDVLYHRCVSDDVGALREIYRVLRKDGMLIINVPAHEHLKRPHDERVHTRHRYHRGELYKMLQKSNFKIIKISYRNTLLFLVLSLLSCVPQRYRTAYSDLRRVTEPLNSILVNILKMENRLLKIMNLPFGSSIFCVARR
jgi:SAM-dependent methyltransferase